MTEKKYRISRFLPGDTWQYACSKMSSNIFRFSKYISETLRMYANDSCGIYNNRILHNTIKNDDTIFEFPEDIFYSSSSSSWESIDSHELHSSFLRCQSEEVRRFMDDLKKIFPTEILETEKTPIDSKKPDKLSGQSEMLSSAENDESYFFPVKDTEIIFNPEETTFTCVEDLECVIKLPFVSLSVIGEYDNDTKVETDIESILMCEDSSPIESEQDSSPSKKTDSPGTFKRLSNSSPMTSSDSSPIESEQDSSPSKKTDSPGTSKWLSNSSPITSTDSSPIESEQDSSPSKKTDSPGTSKWLSNSSPSITSESFQSDDEYLDPNIRIFLVRRFYSILTCQKTCLEDICHFLRKLKIDLSYLTNTIENIICVVKLVPNDLQDELKHLGKDLLSKAASMMEKIKFKDFIVENAAIYEECVKQIIKTENEFYHLSEGLTPIAVEEFRSMEVDLKEVCKKANRATILDEKRKEILSKLSHDFDSLEHHFAKFLIISKILEPSPDS